MSKLNLNKIRTSLSESDERRLGTAKSSPGKSAELKAPSPKKISLKSRKTSVDIEGSGGDDRVGKVTDDGVTRGHHENVPAAKKMPGRRQGGQKTVRAENKAPSGGAKSMDVGHRDKPARLANAKATKPSAAKTKSQGGTPAVGAVDKLKGDILQGLGNEAKAKMTFGGKSPKFDRPGGAGIGGSTKKAKKNAKPKFKSAAEPNMKVSESVFDGSVDMRIGHRKLCLEAAPVKTLRMIIEGYAACGVDIVVDARAGERDAYSNGPFAQMMMEAAHARHHGLASIASERMTQAQRLFRDSIDREYSPTYYATKQDWLKEAADPAFRQARTHFTKLYEGLLETYEVTVRTKDRANIDDYGVVTRALNEEFAALAAVTEVLKEARASASVTHIFVDGRKLNPSAITVGDLFENAPTFFDDMYDAGEPEQTDPTNAKHGDTAKNDGDKPKTAKPQQRSAKYRDSKGSKTADKMPKGKKGQSDIKVDRDPKGPPKQDKVKDIKVESDNGPIFESADIEDQFWAALNTARRTFTGERRKMLEKAMNEIRSGREVSNEMLNFVDEVITVIRK